MQAIRKSRSEHRKMSILADIEILELYRSKFPEDEVNILGTTIKVV